MTPAGKRNRRVTIQRKTVASDADGYDTETWATYKSAMAWIQTMTGREFYSAQKLNAETQALFIVNYVSGITTKDRVLYGTRVFEILSVNNPNEGNAELQIACKEVVDGG